MAKVFQRFNKRNNAWVKMESGGSGTRIVNVKERNPAVPFKGVSRKLPKRKK